uniref:Uncharacterized protein n=1 Tax=Arundo donax TaxID=35708 RepID=A0A0A9BYN6_ARUDO
MYTIAVQKFHVLPSWHMTDTCRLCIRTYRPYTLYM